MKGLRSLACTRVPVETGLTEPSGAIHHDGTDEGKYQIPEPTTPVLFPTYDAPFCIRLLGTKAHF